ncbi:30S ribosomal protein S13 [Candidatus Roizmanbacteria bacterium CG02_land_8_20_14_3_00_36_15]|uniref:Small ribosomal subunit protein uS13 n=1 Tax=Candidatus Roizmanbacteria bacterium CG10_big_fil_rev_8_21_14_0_10_36_26 TaxID=1974851 RepID=A0A2M8KLU8_9BACT|nr:MAG: 30S ribosomal protein S13 [Candidatus Roizmanbacteria bacterium CG02_land_8_20_14_3_00_36_15]PIY70167.1 MAG: 30S ribosomal protein S13 [Candidatus Roizmanbacteria bacterium CG_4_10_14_0_8_um_filter_36_36]PJE60888.1 MAG: 30S ribosomal protein S13 [Candidatus Roizmanbacteria bacterium CG10_big_fil_rev_8_21_14_0_10_36_26]
MIRVHGIILPDNKEIRYALTLLYGIGFSRADRILDEVKVEKNKKVSQISEDEIKKIVNLIDKEYRIEGDLKEEINANIKVLKDIACYRGIRHIRNLPVKGQRTRSNARTKRGKRKTVGALKKEMWSKLKRAGQKTADQKKP